MNQPTEFSIQFVSLEDFLKQYHHMAEYTYLRNALRYIRFCKVEILEEMIFGTMVIPSWKYPSMDSLTFGFLLTAERIIFITYPDKISPLLRGQLADFPRPISSPNLFLYYFLDNLIGDDILYLQEYDQRLSRLEELLNQRELNHFDDKILQVRKDLSALFSYYQQLSEMCEVLQQNSTEEEQHKVCHLFSLLQDKIDRLSSMVQMMTDYSIQLREIHQTKISVRQNQIMQTLTIVTTIFMPLTLVTGWYGMNFSHMPELESPWGYPAVFFVCLLIGLVEVRIFRNKKWF